MLLLILKIIDLRKFISIKIDQDLSNTLYDQTNDFKPKGKRLRTSKDSNDSTEDNSISTIEGTCLLNKNNSSIENSNITYEDNKELDGLSYNIYSLNKANSNSVNIIPNLKDITQS